MARIWLTIIAALAIGGPGKSISAEDLDDTIDEVADSVETWTVARPIKRDPPMYPRTALVNGQEAWVRVMFCIDENGKPQNIEVLDSIGNRDFDYEAIRAVKGWLFEPAKESGEPVWQSRTRTDIVFAFDDEKKGARRHFAKRFRKMQQHVDAREFDKADELFEKILDDRNLLLYEHGKLWTLRARQLFYTNDMHRLSLALDRATASDGQWIDKESYIQLLAIKIQVELNLGMFHAAMESFDKLTEIGPESDAIVSVQPAMDKLQEILNSEEAFAIAGEIMQVDDCESCRVHWSFTPVRQDFAFDNVQGRLTSLDIRCDRKRTTATFSDEVEWHLPDEWGTCYVNVYGDEGTTFHVYQLPPTG